MTTNIADLRQDYQLKALDTSDVDNNPFVQFSKWFDEALKSEILEPNAMTLATVPVPYQADRHHAGVCRADVLHIFSPRRSCASEPTRYRKQDWQRPGPILG